MSESVKRIIINIMLKQCKIIQKVYNYIVFVCFMINKIMQQILLNPAACPSGTNAASTASS